MPREYLTRLVFDRKHRTLALMRNNSKVCVEGGGGGVDEKRNSNVCMRVGG